jgi:hypothetical protein
VTEREFPPDPPPASLVLGDEQDSRHVVMPSWRERGLELGDLPLVAFSQGDVGHVGNCTSIRRVVGELGHEQSHHAIERLRRIDGQVQGVRPSQGSGEPERERWLSSQGASHPPADGGVQALGRHERVDERDVGRHAECGVRHVRDPEALEIGRQAYLDRQRRFPLGRSLDAHRASVGSGDTLRSGRPRGGPPVPKQYTRLTTPLVRDGDRRTGTLRPAGWDEALGRTVAGLQAAGAAHGPQTFGIFSCSKATNEVNFAAQKFSRVVLGSNNIDSCNRT